MGLSKENIGADQESSCTQVTTAKKRRIRRKKLRAAKYLTSVKINIDHNTINVREYSYSNTANIVPKTQKDFDTNIKSDEIKKTLEVPFKNTTLEDRIEKMSSKEGSEKTRDDVMAAREAKKLLKQKAKAKNIKNKDNGSTNIQLPTTISDSETKKNISTNVIKNPPKVPVVCDKINSTPSITTKAESPKSKDEVDRAIQNDNIDINAEKSKELIKAERAAKKAAKQAKKKPIQESGDKNAVVAQDLTVEDVVNTLKDIVNVAKDVQAVTDKVIAIDFTAKKGEESTKSKAELRAERRAKQEAQRASKQAAQQQKPSEVKTEQPSKQIDKPKQEKSSKAATKTAVEKSKPKSQGMQKMNWFQHLYTEHDKESLKQMAINSNLHPAVIKLGVQLASRVVTGSNARCIALLDALKKMVRDYSLPARTEFARGLEAQLAASVEFLWAVRPPAASQTNALKYFRYHLTQLPNNVDEFDAKKRLQEEIDRYIREQIDMAGEAISIAVRNKISTNDNILTYGCSSLIERILCEAQAAGVVFRAVVVGTRLQRGAREMLRRLLARGVRCSYADISALNYLMRDMNKVLVGAASLLANGAVLAPAGTLQAALAARAHNVPLLVACETHKFADTVQTDAFVHNEIGDPDDLIDKNDENSPLKDWRTNPNLSLLNLMYDVTPPSLVTAVVTELAILPCTSAPVVLRFKLSEYGL